MTALAWLTTKLHKQNQDLAVRPHRDVEEPVEEEDEHGGDIIEEYVVPSSQSSES